MSIVTRNTQIPQFRCLPLRGRSDSFRYVQMVNGCWQSRNHDEVDSTVGNFRAEMNQGGGRNAPI